MIKCSVKPVLYLFFFQICGVIEYKMVFVTALQMLPLEKRLCFTNMKNKT